MRNKLSKVSGGATAIEYSLAAALLSVALISSFALKK